MKLYTKKHIKGNPNWIPRIMMNVPFDPYENYGKTEINQQLFMSVIEREVKGTIYKVRNSWRTVGTHHRVVLNGMKVEVYSLNTDKLEYEIGFE